ncbi:MAG: aldehyde dehydrogenase family protein [Methylococcaceae bacterium]|nr:aldehyde dehydrogenase family protein [Methylococcaceae bacterium]MDZ4155404.1 aldehyde dehydrogenase family protein [Methylococcales bacterium]MDP2392956.1 aldehyde dehydrogenase family protein [Methylococcaceae bacterium]MDP3018290.1 aldehyde dehydrogenase family protein [Methylococcaceae bacterium]MDP3391604.1 aldehyde dehydrogenase family protein [Methylococcaceae bacterium]
MAEQLQSISALDGRILNTYPVTTDAEIHQQMAAARLAVKTWAAYTVAERVKILSKLQVVILANVDNITDTLVNVTGKVKTEALLGEIYPVLELLRYYQKHASSILAPCQVSTSPLAFPNASAQYERRPYGVVAIISPWNFPLQLTLNPLITALVCGNAAVIKVSELSIPVGELIVDLLRQLQLPAGLIQHTIGEAAAGQALIDCRPDLVFATGGVAAGRAIMARAAQHPIPVILELGGKDAMLVFADANLARACKAALYGAFSNSGQVCVSVERLYVQQSCFDEFLNMLLDGLANLTVGHGEHGDLGALTSLEQFAVIQDHYQDALDKGAKVSGPLQLNGRYLQPVILWDVTHDMRIMREETFGALLPVMLFDDEQQAIDFANNSDYGLNASVWSQDITKAERVARQLQVGNWAVNDVIKNIGHPGLPFGGVKNSGFGRYHGAEGLRSFTYTVAGLTSRSQLNDEPNWFPYSDLRYQQMRGFVDFMFGSGNLWQRIQRNLTELQAFRGYASTNFRQHWRNFLIFLTNKR